ncbi:MAG: glycosyltransferase family 4 protein [Candidatus Moranbacteria bacterium]|nr:glycosyltransferase family 4 protein [Candidatus Moranbacteria bacterium]MBP6034268.1 glycosyltransferase family 4 protein [Candidatus Moranbacteria bacterium]MBP7695906.1 glycosyltransferase family 4 protein [Candidatus Moranbacteria bacterium]
MIVGIDASRAFIKKRTGIEEYSYQVIKHLRQALESEQVILYIRADQEADLDIPAAWKIQKLWAPRFWTQGRLSLEMLLHPPDVLFVPAHTVPLIHPKRTIVTIHGLEYEFCPAAYAWFERWYMRLSIRFSCWAAERIISVSENTKQDLMRTYAVPEEKIQVIYEGYSQNIEYGISNMELDASMAIRHAKPYLLFIGRLEERKNIVRIIEAFEILKERYHIPHTLVLAGKPGYGYSKIKNLQSTIKHREAVIELGYVSEQEKWELFQEADVFLFPTLYEGFGIPVLEAQSVGVPVVASGTSSLPEVGGDAAVYVDPLNAESIALGVQKLLSDRSFRDGIIEKGKRNVELFSWKKCAQAIATLLRGSELYCLRAIKDERES